MADPHPGASDAHPATQDNGVKTMSIARTLAVVVTAIVLVGVFALLALGAIRQADTLRDSPAPTASGR